MTYEEQILNDAERKCDKLYITELASAAAALIIMLLYVFSKQYEILFISAICFIICAILEVIILIIDSRARKHVNRRLAKINESLLKTIENFPKTRLLEELKEFKKNYGFLEEK